MKWIYLLLGFYVLYYVALALYDKLKGKDSVSDDEDTQIIPVKDMLRAGSFQAKKMELPDAVRKEYMDTEKVETANYRPQRVTGSIYAQGFEVNNYNSQLMRQGRVVFDGVLQAF